jgi:hypothetical protein
MTAIFCKLFFENLCRPPHRNPVGRGVAEQQDDIAVFRIEAEEAQPRLAGAGAGIEEDRRHMEFALELGLDRADLQVRVECLQVCDQHNRLGLALQLCEQCLKPLLELSLRGQRIRQGRIGAPTALLTLASGQLYAHFRAHGFWVMAASCAAALPVARTLRQPAGEPALQWIARPADHNHRSAIFERPPLQTEPVQSTLALFSSIRRSRYQLCKP